jgi:hypothetical protein
MPIPLLEDYIARDRDPRGRGRTEGEFVGGMAAKTMIPSATDQKERDLVLPSLFCRFLENPQLSK